MKPIVSLILLLASSALAACSAQPELAATGANTEAPKAADYAALAAAGVQIYTIDPGSSWLRIYAFRGGRAAFAGHDHVLSSRDFSGQVSLPDKVGDARFDLEFPLDKLIIDDPAMRSAAGGEFAPPLDADAIEGTRKHLLGADNLDAAHFPTLRIHCEHISGELPHLVATIELTLHGQTRPLLVPLEIEADKGRLHAKGTLAIRQTDFGVRPYSVLGGLLSVQDEVSIAFDLVAQSAAR